MCSRFSIGDEVMIPGRLLCFWQAKGVSGIGKWCGFAKSENLGWWQREGWREVDVPAERFAENSDISGEKIWDEVPKGLVIRGVMRQGEHFPEVKIVTRASDQTELEKFQHPRMPLLAPPIYSVELLNIIPRELRRPVQEELF